MNNDHDQREWEAQERARHRARRGEPASPGMPAREPGDESDAYRRIAEALRQPPAVDLPADFAARIASVAEARPRAAAPAPAAAVFERQLMRVLVGAFAPCAVFAGAVYGGRVLAQLQAMAGAQGLQWMALLAASLCVSWALESLRCSGGRGDPARPA